MYAVYDTYSWLIVGMRGWVVWEGGEGLPIMKLQAVQYSLVFTEQSLG